jgi:hypothetical protein
MTASAWCGVCATPPSLDNGAVDGFARLEFELMLLRRMADLQPELVEAACTELGVSHARYMAAHNRWQSMQRSRRSPRGLDLYQAVLGPADARRSEPWGEFTLTAYGWHLPGLWPELQWEIMVGPNGVVLHGWLIRAAGFPSVDLPAVTALAPWSCVVGDIQRCYPQARQSDPQIPAQWLVYLDNARLVFVHGLLQIVSIES